MLLIEAGNKKKMLLFNIAAGNVVGSNDAISNDTDRVFYFHISKIRVFRSFGQVFARDWLQPCYGILPSQYKAR
jgi:hypothetical protein